MCNIWKKKDEGDLQLNEAEKILSSSLFKKIRHVNLTGGEPFLRPDLPEIAETMWRNCPNLRSISVSTNGYLTEKITGDVRKILEDMPDTLSLNVTISVDGPREIHNKVRGISTAYDSAFSTIGKLSEIRDERFSLGAQITVSKYNVHSLRETYNLVKKFCSRINITPVMLSDGYFGNRDSESSLALNPAEKKELLSFLDEVIQYEPEHAYYYSKIREEKRVYPCTAFYKSMYVDAAGNIYPCQYLPDFCVGSSLREDAAKLWFSGEAGRLRKKLKECSYCRTCFNNCDIISTMQDEFFDFSYFLAQNPKIAASLIKKISVGGYGEKFI